jgi:hypothetical protein
MKLHPNAQCVGCAFPTFAANVKYDFRLINHASGVPVARASSSSN